MKIQDYNLENHEITTRDATKEELAQADVDVANEAAWKAEVKSKERAKAALLDRLGITADEAALLLK